MFLRLCWCIFLITDMRFGMVCESREWPVKRKAERLILNLCDPFRIPRLLFTAAIEIYYVISFRFRLLRRNRRNFICRNPLNAGWGVEGTGGTVKTQGSNRIPPPPAPQYLIPPLRRRFSSRHFLTTGLIFNAPLCDTHWMAALGPCCSSLILPLSPSLLSSPTADSIGQEDYKAKIWRNSAKNQISPKQGAATKFYTFRHI